MWQGKAEKYRRICEIGLPGLRSGCLRSLLPAIPTPEPRKRLRPRGLTRRWKWILVVLVVLLLIPAMQVGVLRLTLSLPLIRPPGLPIYVARFPSAPFIKWMAAAHPARPDPGAVGHAGGGPAESERLGSDEAEPDVAMSFAPAHSGAAGLPIYVALLPSAPFITELARGLADSKRPDLFRQLVGHN